jgi:enoyl-CoA hydratase/carnithine racemase
MTYESLLYEVTGALARITINRPDKLNALNGAVIAELDRAIGEIARDPAVRGVVLTGAGPKAFVAGADIGEIAAQGPVDGKARALEGQRVFRRLERCGKPVVAAVNGFALGGGCELAMACHLRVAAEGARFGQPEVKLGIMPGGGATQRLTQAVGKFAALHILLRGEPFSAEAALALGLASEVVDDAQVEDRALQVAGELAQLPQLSLRLIKEAVLEGLNSGLESGLRFERRSFQALFSTGDKGEGMRARLEKREPKFTVT